MAWNLLFSSDIGLLSLFTILFCLVMGAYIAVYASRHAKEDEKNSTTANQARTVR
ncbi:MAG: DUF3149 domain-containing protein [Azonexus sp.]|nr:DUF3149 domain-containing protein [Azonexus sp.]